MNHLFCFAALVALMSLPTPSFSQSPQETPQKSLTPSAIKETFLSMCRTNVSGVLQNQQSKMPFMDMKKLGDVVCDCSSARTFTDSRVREILDLPEKEFDLRARSSNFRLYLISKMGAAMFTCLGNNMEEQTNNANLTF